MAETMTTQERQKAGNSPDIREGRGAPTERMARDRRGPRRHEPPDGEIDKRMQDVYVRLKANEGRGPYASRRIANAAHGITKPHRPLARILRDARRKGCLDEVMKAITKTLYQAAMRDSAA